MAKRRKGALGVTLEWYGDDLQRAVKRRGDRALFEMGEVVLGEAQRNAPSRTGQMRRSGYVAIVGRSTHTPQKRDRKKLPVVVRGSATVAFASWYSNILEDTGASAHVIPYKGKTRRARVRHILKIPGIGYRQVVMHPGMKRKPFLGPALETTKTEMVRKFAGVLGDDLERDLK